MLRCGGANLSANIQTVNELNVFPVPDGDTGTNMEFTMKGAIQGAEGSAGDISEAAKGMAKGALMGARGNSGVITSQFLKGIAVSFQDKTNAGAEDFAEAFKSGVEYAYKSVLKPTEGTILTVMREATAYAFSCLKESPELDTEGFLTAFLKEANDSLKRTPELLPVLKKAGVVDSGAVGLIYIVEGMLKALRGEEAIPSEYAIPALEKHSAFGADSVLEYGYCTEFILQLMNAKTDIAAFDIKIITDYLETIGDSIVAIKDEDVVKIHVHTKTPAKAIEFCQRYGEFVTFKMENMSVQHSETEFAGEVKPDAERVKYAVVAVATGEGLKNTFRDMGAGAIIEGGQTMNPSSEDFLKAFKALNAENIIVFPNNSNVYPAAKQAADMYGGAAVRVVKTATVAEGYAALTMFDPSCEDEETLIADLERAAGNVCTLSVTHSVRDGTMDGVVYKKGDYICIAGKTLLSSASDKTDAAISALKNLKCTEDREVLTAFYGEGVSEEDKKSLISRINAQFPHLETYEINGGQAVYPYILAIE